MWRVLAGLRPLARGSARGGPGFRFYSGAAPKAPKKKIGMAELVKQYGWTATGVYLALSFVDLPLSYLLVHSAGQERIEDVEIGIRKLIGADPERESTYIHKAAAGGKSFFWTEFGIAYIIHKSLIVLRVPLVVAITPAIARQLQHWGFNVTRAMPTVDKQQLAARVASHAEASDSAAVKRVANAFGRASQSPASKDALKNAAKDRLIDESKRAAAKTDSGAPQFGKPPSSKRRWFWFF